MSNADHLSHLVRACHHLNPVCNDACPLTLLFVMQVTIIDPCRVRVGERERESTKHNNKGGKERMITYDAVVSPCTVLLTKVLLYED